MNQQMKILRLPQVMSIVGLGKTAIYKRIKTENFPAPIKLGSASGWIESDVYEWVASQVTAQRQAA